MTGPADVVGEIRRLYYATTKATIQRDLARAIALLKTLPHEDAREGAAVYMDGLAQLRTEWSTGRQDDGAATKRHSPAPPRRRR